MEVAGRNSVDHSALLKFHVQDHFRLGRHRIHGHLAEIDRVEGPSLFLEHDHDPPDRVLHGIGMWPDGHFQAELFIRLYLCRCLDFRRVALPLAKCFPGCGIKRVNQISKFMFLSYVHLNLFVFQDSSTRMTSA